MFVCLFACLLACLFVCLGVFGYTLPSCTRAIPFVSHLSLVPLLLLLLLFCPFPPSVLRAAFFEQSPTPWPFLAGGYDAGFRESYQKNCSLLVKLVEPVLNVCFSTAHLLQPPFYVLKVSVLFAHVCNVKTHSTLIGWVGTGARVTLQRVLC